MTSMIWNYKYRPASALLNCAFAFIMVFVFSSCEAQPHPKTFSESALNDRFLSVDGTSVVFSELLEAHKDKTILIDVWASWCRDCITGFPKVKSLQNDYKDAVFLFLSLDKNEESWKKGINNYNLKGEHYFMSSGWEGPFGKFLDLDWIPRYVVVDTKGQITVFKSIKADDKALKKALEQ